MAPADPRLSAWESYYVIMGSWLWFTILPCGAYAALALGAVSLRVSAAPALFVIGATALGLLLIGIHNAWDTVTHLVVGGSHRDQTKAERPSLGSKKVSGEQYPA